jgi:hypothetical protein
MIVKKKQGYLLMEAILASALISSAILFRTQIELKHDETESIREFAVDVASVPYAIDKRVLLDGHTLNLSKKIFVGAEDTFTNLLKKSLIGNKSSACTGGGWVPKDSLNAGLNLISCKQFNPRRMPFRFEMDGGYELNANNSVRSFYIDLYHTNTQDFTDYAHVYAKLVNFARLQDPPQITGSHKYSLRHRSTKKELTPLECANARELCSIRAEYQTNYVGLGEDVYLRVNGSNFMHSSIKFKAMGTAAYQCSKVDTSGTITNTTCGIEYKAPTSTSSGSMNVNSDSVNAQSLNLANSRLKSSTGALIPVNCRWENSSTLQNVACGMSIVKDPSNSNKVITRATLHDVSATGKIYASNGSSKTFSVDAASGNVMAKGNVDSSGTITSKKGANLNFDNRNRMLIDTSKIEFSGVVPRSTKVDTFRKVSGTSVSKELASELVTKGYMHSFHQIIDISVRTSGNRYNLYRCPDGQYARVAAFPYNSSLLMSGAQVERVCPYRSGSRLPSNNIVLSLQFPKPNTISGSVSLTQSYGCKWEGDYVQAWYMNEDRTSGKYVPRFYLISPKQSGTGAVANVEVRTQFTTIQYCGVGNLG